MKFDIEVRKCSRQLCAEDLYGDGLIFKIPQFLTRDESKSIIDFASSQGFIRVTQRESKEYAFRDNDRILLRLPIVSEGLWKRMAQYVPKTYEGMTVVGLNPAIRFYKYSKGQRFGCHVDESDTDPETGCHSRFTVLIYLNDKSDSELEGGSTIFYENGSIRVLTMEPETGTALIHGHGDKCLLHEGSLVTKGAKFVLRTDVMYH
jgi:hypothetical protein